MSDWYWRVIALKAAFVLTCVVSYLKCEDDIMKLPFCNPNNNINGANTPINDLVIVSTLDGRLTAFYTQDGAKAWHLETQPLFSSNLHNVELSSGGKWVRLVPSLRGSLYSVSEDTIEALPIDADKLLSSTFKYSDDLVIAGGRESAWTGVDARTGAVVYECGGGDGGCGGERARAAADSDLLVLRRLATTVRALDPRTGVQKWNFSVAEHQVALSARRECLPPRPAPAATPAAPAAGRVAVALPEGVLALRHPDTHLTVWQHKLEAPVAGLWRLHGGALQHMDVLWEAARSLHASASAQPTPAPAPPSLYIGVHHKQLYVQEGQLYAQQQLGAGGGGGGGAEGAVWRLQRARPRLPGAPTALAPTDAAPPTASSDLSLHTLYDAAAGDIENHGFFLYERETCDESLHTPDLISEGPEGVLPNESDNHESHQHVHVHVSSLWFWWKEVLLIAVSSALLMNLMIWPRFFAPKLPRAASPASSGRDSTIVVVRRYSPPPGQDAGAAVVAGAAGAEYSGRYDTDFTPLRCLGRGGFGWVFEARNNIDHCSYAVKRITLPRREQRRERVLREVRALAKLEHEHIVRYFNAWLEEPPPRWQEARDALWMRTLPGVPEDFSTTSPTDVKTPVKDIKLDLRKCCEHCVDTLDYDKVLSTSKRYRSQSCSDSFVIEFDENASKPRLSHTGGTDTDADTRSITGDTTPPNCLSRRSGTGTGDDDSFIQFANTGELDASADKRLTEVKQGDSYTKSDGSHHSRKKKGHTRHWSLDMCVRGGEAAGRGAPDAPKMYLYIQMQLCRPDSLHDWLRNNNTLQARGRQVRILFSQIVSAVEYVHLAGLIHRDLKPSNIFFALDGKVKVGDFGLVTAMSDGDWSGQGDAAGGDAGAAPRQGHTHKVGTLLYMSPEQRAGRAYSSKVDIYSLGVILFELLQPFGTEAERVAALEGLRAARYPPPFVHAHPEETEVLKLMLSSDPSQRPTASNVRARALLYECEASAREAPAPAHASLVGRVAESA